MTMTVEAVPREEARDFLLIPEVWKLSADDDSSTDFELPRSVLPIGGRLDNGSLAGLSLVHPYRDGWKLHFYVLRRHRLRWARPLVRLVMEASARAGVIPLYAVIPAVERGVINFALRAGFRRTGIDPEDESREVLKWAS